MQLNKYSGSILFNDNGIEISLRCGDASAYGFKWYELLTKDTNKEKLVDMVESYKKYVKDNIYKLYNLY